MQTIFWIIAFGLFHKGTGLSHHIRHERTRYMSGKNQIYESNYSPKLDVQDYIPFIHYWERPLQLLESSMNVPKKLSSRPLFSWDIPVPMSTYSPLRKWTTTSENPVNDASVVLTNLPSDTETADDKFNKIDYVAAKKIQVSHLDRLNRAKDSETIRTSFPSKMLKKKRKSNNHKKSIDDQMAKALEGEKAQTDERAKNESVAGRVRRKKKDKKIRKGKSQRKNKIGKEVGNGGSAVEAESGERKTVEVRKPLKKKKSMVVAQELKTQTEPPVPPCELLENKCEHKCQEINGTATCLCFKGFTPMGSRCVDINECEHNNGGCNGKCVNTIGSKKCICSSGYRLVEGTCSDVNECLLRNGHGPCQDKCTNTVGSYHCSCENIPGTVLASDKHTCEESGECKIEEAGCSHSCVNVSGRAFCMCPDGFELGDDWKTCHDIDECSNKEDHNVICESDCVNTVGSYVCLK